VRRILFAIDVSGSMPTSLTPEKVNEIISNLCIHQQSIDIVEFHIIIQNSYLYEGYIKDFSKPNLGTTIDSVALMFVKDNYDECFCLTDGYVDRIKEPLQNKWTWLLYNEDTCFCSKEDWQKILGQNIIIIDTQKKPIQF